MEIFGKTLLFLDILAQICTEDAPSELVAALYPLASRLGEEIRDYRRSRAAQSGDLAAGGLAGAAGEPSGSAASGKAPFDTLGV